MARSVNQRKRLYRSIYWGRAHCAGENVKLQTGPLLQKSLHKTSNQQTGHGPPRQPGTPRPGSQVHGPRSNTKNHKRLQRQIQVRLNAHRRDDEDDKDDEDSEDDDDDENDENDEDDDDDDEEEDDDDDDNMMVMMMMMKMISKTNTCRTIFRFFLGAASVRREGSISRARRIHLETGRP